MKGEKTLAAIDLGLYVNQDTSPRWHLGASIIGGECPRAIFYNHRWAARVMHQPRTLRIFERGSLEEPRIVRWLRAAGIAVVDTMPDGAQIRVVDSTGHFGGSLDSELSGVPDIPPGEIAVGEFKTHNENSFANVCAKGVQASKPTHFTQVSIYMAARGRRYGVYVAVNKNDDDLYIEIIEWGADTQAAVERANARAHQLLTSDEAPPRISENPAFFICKWCDFKAICHGLTTPEVNCRTCAHVSVGAEGTWVCTRFDHVFTKDNEDTGSGDAPRMIDGCPAHVFNPHILNGVEYVGGDEEENYVELKLQCGTLVRNGPTYTPSDRLCLSDPAPISKKPSTPSSGTSTRKRKARP